MFKIIFFNLKKKIIGISLIHLKLFFGKDENWKKDMDYLGPIPSGPELVGPVSEYPISSPVIESGSIA
jgi:hypothetical protein